MRHLFYSLGVLLIVICSACNEDLRKSTGVKPGSFGVLNEVIAVADKEDWNTMIGDTFQYYFASAYPLMPSPEPFFDIRYFSKENLDAEPLRKQLRTYVVLCNLNDDDSAVTKMVKQDLGEDRFMKIRKTGELKTSLGKDKWARGQIIIYILGRNEDELAVNIRENFSAIAKRIHVHNEEQLHARVYANNVNLGLSERVKNSYHIDLTIPSDYVQLPKIDDDFMWLRKDTKNAILNIAIKKMPYKNQEQLTKDYLKELTNQFGQNVDAEDINNTLVINDVDLPVFDYTREVNGQYAKEIRGIWEMTKSFDGGPFGSYMIHNKKAGEIVFIATFVHAPGKSKRDYMQELEYLVKSIKFEA